ncbi:MAG: hypothetical protein A2252_12365 [Elusimicrobia bacterium RIFOXYA2_FULL_39_19]|nr:MAG: hypothetical protein A2252_12365 [Elusimicrobia bacterium RIFOXYA2_FULL_39_19]
MKKNKGKVLKVKYGYNPNSSSVGTLLLAFPVSLFVVAALVNVVSVILMDTKGKSKKDEEKNKK